MHSQAQATLENKATLSLAVIPSSRAPLPGIASQAQRSETGMWVGVAAITMCFAAFTSAMIVRQESSTDWQHFQLPHVLYLNTLILLASSVTLEWSRQRIAAISDASQRAPESTTALLASGIYWLYVTAALGVYVRSRPDSRMAQPRGKGVFLATNPSSSFFYVFTALHAVHLLGGMGGLFYVLRKLVRSGGSAETSGLSAFSIYWHFMDMLWVYLLLLLAIRV